MRKAGWLLIAPALIVLLTACGGNDKKKTTAAAPVRQPERWTCSMHPEIIRDRPGSCPICGMDLIRKETRATAVTGIQLDELLQPTDKFVVSSIAVTTVEKKDVQMEVQALGTVSYDTRYINTISARVSGRIEKLYVKYRYQHVHKGARIMDIYSPELVTAQEELLFLLKNDPSNHPLIDAARQRLLLLGMAPEQLQQVIQSGKASQTVAVYSNYTGHLHEAGNTMPAMEATVGRTDITQVTEELSVKEGMYVQKGQNIFQLYNTDRSWVLLNIFSADQGTVKQGDAVSIIPETAPGKRFRGRIDFIEPVYRKDSKTLVARVYFDNAGLQVPIGSQVRATIISRLAGAGWLPKDAVLSLGIGKVVFIKTGSGFRAHKISTSVTYQDKVQVVDGLSAADSVAANAQFLADSESFIKSE